MELDSLKSIECSRSGEISVPTSRVCNRISLCRIITPVTVAERPKARTIFARSEAGILGWNHTQDMDVWYVYVIILCLCCPVFS
jgi:hypothetical protein